MAGQVMEAHHQQRLQPPAMPPFVQPGCKNDVHHHHHHQYNPITTSTMTTAAAMATPSGSNTTTAADMAAYLQQLQDTAEAAHKNGGGGAARGEQCPRCASHDTKFCYYNNYNTSQPRHFCRACRRYWTLGGSLRNVPIGGSTRKRPRLAHHHHGHHHSPARRAPLFVGLGLAGSGGGGPTTMPPMPPPSSSSQSQGGAGLLGSLFALGAGSPLLEGPAAPMLEGRGGAGFDLGLGPPAAGGPVGGGGNNMQMQGFGLRGGGVPAGVSSSGLFWPAGLLDNDSVDAWKLPPGAGISAAMWPEFSAAAAAQAGGLLHGGTQLM